MFSLQQEVIHEGRPAVVMNGPEIGATGATIYAIRYTDIERWEPDPHFPQYMRPVKGSAQIVREDALTVA